MVVNYWQYKIIKVPLGVGISGLAPEELDLSLTLPVVNHEKDK